jgi:hypothetical protein
VLRAGRPVVTEMRAYRRILVSLRGWALSLHGVPISPFGVALNGYAGARQLLARTISDSPLMPVAGDQGPHRGSSRCAGPARGATLVPWTQPQRTQKLLPPAISGPPPRRARYQAEPERTALRRPIHDHMLTGVAAGLAEYVGVDVMVVPGRLGGPHRRGRCRAYRSTWPACC